jgi:hypothetical protein
MTFQCEDLPNFGLVLVPPSSPDYEPPFAEIARRVECPREKRETSAILVNNSDGARLATGYGLLLPFSASAAALKIMTYRTAILPGSRRYLWEHGIAGDNTDVRGPEHDEVWKGGIIFGSGTGGGHCTPALPIKSVTLILHGVFFLDGEFAAIARAGRDRGIATVEILREIEEPTGPPPKHPPAPGKTMQSAHIRSNGTDSQ